MRQRFGWDRERRYDAGRHVRLGWDIFRRNPAYEPETLAYAAAHTMTDAEKLALDLEIKGIKSGTPLTLSSLTLNLSLDGKFITRVAAAGVAFDLNRYSGISGVQYSVAATGTPAVTAVFGGTVAAGTGETIDANLFTNGDFASDEPPGTAWSKAAGYTVSGGVLVAASVAGSAACSQSLGTAGSLYKFTWDLVSCTAGGFRSRLSSTIFGAARTVPATYVNYMTSGLTGSGVGFQSSGTSSGTIDNAIVQKVLTPDTTGILASTLTDGGINANSATYTVTISKP